MDSTNAFHKSNIPKRKHILQWRNSSKNTPSLRRCLKRRRNCVPKILDEDKTCIHRSQFWLFDCRSDEIFFFKRPFCLRHNQYIRPMLQTISKRLEFLKKFDQVDNKNTGFRTFNDIWSILSDRVQLNLWHSNMLELLHVTILCQSSKECIDMISI